MNRSRLLKLSQRFVVASMLMVGLSACNTLPGGNAGPNTQAKSPAKLAADEMHQKLDALSAADTSRRSALADQNKRLELLQQEMATLRDDLDQTRRGTQQLGQQVSELRNYIARAYGMPIQPPKAQQPMAQAPAQPAMQQSGRMAQDAQQAAMGRAGRAMGQQTQGMQSGQQPPNAATQVAQSAPRPAGMQQPGQPPMRLPSIGGTAPNTQPGMQPPMQQPGMQAAMQPQGMQQPGFNRNQPGMQQPAKPAIQAPGVSTPPANAVDAYKQAKLYVTSGQYDQALVRFQGFLKSYPNDKLADNAQYWLGEMHYVQRDFRNALVEFNQVLVKWPTSDKVPDSLLKIGFAFFELEDYENSRRALEQLVQNFPNSPAVPLAMQRLKRIETAAAAVKKP
uniref:Cell division coordinator CpoB n=1 Tax=Magnetococcus massalia (strain MO-1) TaxID=451514 RepID=A0A1S7LMT8_MAGMO|nr:Protein of unknown function. Tetratricopeptide TPR_2 repeat protein [Candidatus Magnetococcus massalia]